MKPDRILAALAGLLILGLAIQTRADDWPMWRHDPGRSADSPEALPATLHLQWVREYSQRKQVWDDPLNRDLMPYDKVFEPVVLGDRMFVGFNDTDKVVALDIHTGRELWRFYTDGPVRLPPVAWRDNVYFASDDGQLYCVRAADGVLQWKVPGGPTARKALGNGRVISTWPARGGPVIRDDTVYFAASIWPFMGTFIQAVDAATGKIVWRNDSTSSQFIKQPHNAPAFAGVAPQGALVATKDVLIVPGSRSIPAAFDRHTGELLHFKIAEGGKGNGGSFVIANESEIFVHTRERGVRDFDLKTGNKGKFTPNEPVLGQNRYYTAMPQSSAQSPVMDAKLKIEANRYTELKATGGVADAVELGSESAIEKAKSAIASTRAKVAQAEEALAKAEKALSADDAGPVIQGLGANKKIEWELKADGTGDIIKAGNRLYAAGASSLVAVELPREGKPAELVWSHPVEGRVLRLLAANGKLFAVTLDGRILAFGGEEKEPATLREAPLPIAPAADVVARAKAIIQQAGVSDGYALCYGADDGQLVGALAIHSRLRIVAVDRDAGKVDRLRRRFDDAGLYGNRVTVHQGDAATFKAPPYIANLVVVGNDEAARLTDKPMLETIYQSVRPYGGTLWVCQDQRVSARLLEQIRGAGLPRVKVATANKAVVLVREGALPGSADWTHLYGDVANTVKSDDQTVKLSLGVLWFGGNSNEDVLPRHGHGPPEQVVGGRVFLEGMDCLSARDVYTGRQLWKTTIPGLNTSGIYYDDTHLTNALTILYSQRHIPGANARGVNFVATEDSVYVAAGSQCIVLDPATGAIVRNIPMPAGPGQSAAPEWGYLGVYEDVLLGGTDFAHFNRRFQFTGPESLSSIGDFAASTGLAAFDRHTGALLWRTDARHSFIHNGIVAGGGRVYCLDRLPKSAETKADLRGMATPAAYRIAAFDARTGSRLWENTNGVFGTWLSYSKEHDLLLQAGAAANDRLKDEVREGMAVLRGRDGREVWRNASLKYTGPCILYHDLIITTPTSYKMSAGAYNLLDGKPHLIANPLTGQLEPWKIYRTYGCNTPIASEHLMTFRSGAAGFYDLETHGGTGNFGGFRSGCSDNLIVANGVLNAPDFTRTCSCPYQNQASLALVHMPELEFWTHNLFGSEVKGRQRIERVGINFGAPGDRRAASGTVWLAWPPIGGTSPEIPVALDGGQPTYFCRHASQLAGDGLSWVAASGLREASSIRITPELTRSKPPPAPKGSKEDEEDEADPNAAQTGGKAGEQAGTSADASTPLPPVSYTVRLCFVEPDDLSPGQRVFNVALQGRDVLKNFDPIAEAGGKNRGLVKEFKRVSVTTDLTVTLTPASASAQKPVICGIELIAETSASR